MQLYWAVLSIVTVIYPTNALSKQPACILFSLQAERHHSVPQGALTSRDAVRDPLHRVEKHRLSLLQAVQRPRQVCVSLWVPLPQVGHHTHTLTDTADDGLRIRTQRLVSPWGWSFTCVPVSGRSGRCVWTTSTSDEVPRGHITLCKCVTSEEVAVKIRRGHQLVSDIVLIWKSKHTHKQILRIEG